jgi:phosphatidate cytidylyltransferase
MFAKRLFSSIVLWTVLLTVLFYANYVGPIPSAILCCSISTIALWEFYLMLEKGGVKTFKRMGLIGGIALSAGSWWFCLNYIEYTNTFEVLVLITIVISLFVRQICTSNNPRGIETIGATLAGIIYIPWLFNFLPKIKFLYFHDGKEGPGWLFVFYVVVATKFCDIGAYAFGRLFGKHKMIPRISPNKTWEGLVGGLLTAVIASVVAFYYMEKRIGVSGFSLRDSIALGIILGILGVLGDLSESLIKREMNVKDSGELLPGIGGALDLIDSLLFTAPALYAYLLVLKLTGGG